MTRNSSLTYLTSPSSRCSIIAVCAIGTLFILFTWLWKGSSHIENPFGHLSHGSSKLSIARQRSIAPVSNGTLGFEKILAINLPERTDHRDGLILASSVSGIHIEFVDGVRGETVSAKALPGNHAENMDPARIGSWRAHMNAISRVVENNWTSALILEDDVDWDVRLKRLLQDFALASDTLLRRREPVRFNFRDLSFTDVPQSSPYGDGWDVLWLGHCGMLLPQDSSTIVQENDDSVPEIRNLVSYEKDAVSPLAAYPQHTRIVSRQRENTCSLAYAVSQSGARGLLYSLALNKFDSAFDLMLRDWCEGEDSGQSHNCFTVLPQLFDHHRRAGPVNVDSDISAPGSGFRDKPFTPNIRWSVRMNMPKILRGETDYDDQWPDSES